MSMNSRKAKPFVPLADEKRTHVDTATAAYHLGRQPQTLRVWACLGGGLVTPMQLGGRLAWKVADIRKVLGF